MRSGAGRNATLGFDWCAAGVGALVAGTAMLAIPAAAMRAFPAPGSLGATAATLHDASVWLPAFVLALVLVTAATAALTRSGSAIACGLVTGIVGYWIGPAPVFIVRHASEHDCGTESGCTGWSSLLIEAIVFAGLFTILVAVLAALGAAIGAAAHSLLRSRRNAHSAESH